MTKTKEELTWRRSVEHPDEVPWYAEPLLWEGVVYGDYWITPEGKVYKKNGELMPEHPHHTGYPRVSIIKNGKSTSLNVHNLVAYTFKPVPSKLLPAIDHVDVDKTNHELHNLEWVGQSENTRRAYQEGANKSSKPVAAYDSDGNIVDVWYAISAADKEMKESGKRTRATVKGVLGGTSRHKKAYGYKWQYIDWETYERIRGTHQQSGETRNESGEAGDAEDC